jgi:hypothetical protein
MAAMERGNQGVEEHAVFVVLVSSVFVKRTKFGTFSVVLGSFSLQALDLLRERNTPFVFVK